jgi:hypothetical protein
MHKYKLESIDENHCQTGNYSHYFVLFLPEVLSLLLENDYCCDEEEKA